MDPLDLVAIADRIGIIAFAISGVAVGIRARMDLYGLVALGMVTAIGGGVTRDVVIGDLPRAFVTTDYLLFAAASTAIAIVAGAVRLTIPGLLMRAADSIGTGAFAATGALLAIEAGLAWPAALLLAVLTATGGGILRDLLAGRIPHVLRAELNATGAAAGGLVVFALRATPAEAAIVGALVAAAVTAIGHTGRFRLPVIGDR